METKKVNKLLKEFKEFAVKGNVIDLAVGVIIGSAFSKIISSLVADIIMPPIGFLLGGVNFTDMKINLKEAVIGTGGIVIAPAIKINIGLFIQNILDFLIIAFVIFFMVKAITKLKAQLKLTSETETVIKPLTKDQELLTEIKDLLQTKNSQNQ